LWDGLPNPSLEPKEGLGNPSYEELSVLFWRGDFATVNEALREYGQRRQRREALQSFGGLDFDPSYDYKSQRSKR
jgi:hypothetical protein